MRYALEIALLQFRMIVKSRASLIMMFLMPLIFVLIFGVLVGGGSSSDGGGQVYPVALDDRDGTLASRLLAEALKDHPSVRLQSATSAEMKRLFADKALAAGLIIPEGFERDLLAGKAPELQVASAPGGNLALAVTPLVRREAARLSGDFRIAHARAGGSESTLRAALAEVQRDREAYGVAISTVSLQRQDARQGTNHTATSYTSLGFTVMFVMMLVFMMGGSILQERQNGTWGRLLTTPVPRVSLLAGYLLSFFLTGMAQFTILVMATRYLFGVRWGSLPPLFALAAALVMCSAGLGIFVAGIVRTAEQQRTIAQVSVVATSMLGGVYWPLDVVGETMQRIGYLTPQAWAMEGLTEVMMRGGGFGQIWLPVAVLLGLTLIFMTAGLLRVRYE